MDLGIDDYEIRAWITTLGSVPVERLFHADYSECYETDEAHVFKLENGKYAFVEESGCSCYGPENASIDVLGDLDSAKKKFDEWVTKQKRYKHEK